MRTIIADMETNNNIEDCRPYAIGSININNLNDDINIYTDITEFMGDMLSENTTVYFHNLKFDGSFIIDWLFKYEFEHIVDTNDKKEFCFTTVIDDMGNFFDITVYIKRSSKNWRKVIFRDSFKLIPMPLKRIPKNFGLNIEKLDETYDYDNYRPIGYQLTKSEVKYLTNDVKIMGQALQIMFKQGINKMTIAGSALDEYKKLMTNDWFNETFPKPYYDDRVRTSYKGGFTYLNPIYKNKIVENETVLDVNSLYPYVMATQELPYGTAIEGEGQYTYDEEFPLYIQRFTCEFKIKANHIPTVQIKNSSRFVETEYLTDSDGIVELNMTSVDLKLFFEHYNVDNIVYLDYFKFQSSKNLFKNYIDKWTNVKIKADKDGNKGMRQIAKLMLNSLYGKFGVNPNSAYKVPYLCSETGLIKYKSVKELRKPIYVPVASFITSYAREITISTSQKIKSYSIDKYNVDKYIYSDTDSVHTLLTEKELLECGIDVDNYKLGHWKNEGEFKKAKYLRAKTYIQEDNDNKTHVTCAGMPIEVHKIVTFETFTSGNKFEGKLQAKKVKGGTVLIKTTFTIS